jgi:hypothetical protein
MSTKWDSHLFDLSQQSAAAAAISKMRNPDEKSLEITTRTE